MQISNEKLRAQFSRMVKIAVAVLPILLLCVTLRVPSSVFQVNFSHSSMSGGLLKYFIVNVLGLWILGIMIAFMIRAGKKHRARQTPQAGSAILEFALVLPFALMIILVIVQSCLLMIGNICVHNAAYNAARAAIVYIPADYSSDGEPANYLRESNESAKYNHIHKAACWAMLPVSYAGTKIEPQSDRSLKEGLDEFYQYYGEETPRWVRSENYLLRKLAYALQNTVVRFDSPQNGYSWQANEDVKVYVEHNFLMLVPYANILLAFDPDFIETEYGYAIKMKAHCTLTNEGVRNWIELETIWN